MARSRISSRSDLSPLVSALSRLADRVGEGPVSLSVSLTDSNEVLSLRARIESLEKELDALRASYNHTEFLYRCEVVVNTELLDLCGEHGIKVRRSMFDRLRE